jgi:hypothetical protein
MCHANRWCNKFWRGSVRQQGENISAGFSVGRVLEKAGNSLRVTGAKDRQTTRRRLAHMLLRWQEEGIEIYAASFAQIRESELIRINRPSQFRMHWYRPLALLGVKRAISGGFLAWPRGAGGGQIVGLPSAGPEAEGDQVPGGQENGQGTAS